MFFFKMSRLWQISAAAKPIAIALQHPMPCKTNPKTLGFELLTYKWSINLYKWPKIIGQLSTGALRPGGNHRVLVEELMPSGHWIHGQFFHQNPTAKVFFVEMMETDPQLTKDDSTGFNFVVIFALYLYFKISIKTRLIWNSWTCFSLPVCWVQ